MPTIREYQSEAGRSPFGQWFWRLDPLAAARITRIIGRLESGLRPDVKAVGVGVFETRIDFGPGYRVYFGVDGSQLIILLGGGDKSSQASDIALAKERWVDYRTRKKRDG